MKRVLSFFIVLFASLQLFAQNVDAKIDALLTAYANQNKFNGVVLVAQKGNIIYQKGFGVKDAEKRLPVDVNTVFQIGSVTKQFTAAVIMQLQEEGKLSVEDKLSKYFPELPNAEKITIEHLLTHTSGLYNYTNDTAFKKADVSRPYSQKDMLALFSKYRPDFEPGAKWNYSNTGYSLLGYIIEKVTGKAYEQVVRERILQPLQMNHSGFDFTHLASADKAKGYFMLTSTKTTAAPIVDSTIAYSAGAMYSTVSDLYKWDRAIYSGKILKPQSWQKIFTPYKNKYGYGWGIDSLYGRQITAHSGGIHGFAARILRFPKEELVVIMMDNSSGTNLGKISMALSAIVFNQPYEIPGAKTEIKLDESVLKQYVGEYQLAPTFSITVRLKDGRLVAQATGQPEFDLYAAKENRFFLKVVDAEMEFVKDASGIVTEMILYQNGLTPKGKKIK